MLILFIYISNDIPLPYDYSTYLPSQPPFSLPLCLYEGASPPTHPLPPHHPNTPLDWVIEPPQDQGPPLPLMPDKALSASSVLPLTPPLGSQWLTISIHISIGQDLAEPLRRQLYQAPVSKYFLASGIVSGFGVCMWAGSPGGAVSG